MTLSFLEGSYLTIFIALHHDGVSISLLSKPALSSKGYSLGVSIQASNKILLLTSLSAGSPFSLIHPSIFTPTPSHLRHPTFPSSALSLSTSSSLSIPTTSPTLSPYISISISIFSSTSTLPPNLYLHTLPPPNHPPPPYAPSADNNLSNSPRAHVFTKA
ncbi:uncharacterized protein BDR25DRAFT_347820 [Lindgomyces ingoldianus]|uniref:Uncharacterized protein n=1 Tax=Lindgomyces ingoldianus TaxID=673940 RepID=A0ACB6RDZ5_9PLEO|nr:uncharacterized protein BDR25DRAFT_347820 [Lindgomyces ingoldianus]KAF2477464.1 hypothetical protein BDR25DRAFT_347820 [Lindgomyces ingoldianus]